MATIITGIEAQPRFPHEDLTEANAAVLELTLMNAEIVEEGHKYADGQLEFFRYVHPAVAVGVDSLYDDARYAQAAFHGVSVYETLAMFVGARWRHLLFLGEGRPEALSVVTSIQSSRNSADDAFSAFRGQMRNTAEVVRTSSARFYGPLADYALLGAAITWQTAIAFAPTDKVDSDEPS